MDTERMRAIATSVGIVAAIALALSLLWHVPYIYSAIGAVGVSLLGYIVTLDEDLPDGWAPQPGGVRAIWFRLATITGIIAALIVLALLFPVVRAFGG